MKALLKNSQVGIRMVLTFNPPCHAEQHSKIGSFRRGLSEPKVFIG